MESGYWVGVGGNLDPGIETPYVSCLEISRDDFARIYFEGNVFFYQRGLV